MGTAFNLKFVDCYFGSRSRIGCQAFVRACVRATCHTVSRTA
jgi:hypothetical protein